MTGLKIGVLTFHRCINYGSYWQARCLVEALQRRGHNATILDHNSQRINLAEWKCAFRPVLPASVAGSDHTLYKKKIRKFFQAFEKLPLSDPFPLDQPEEMEYVDIVVVGSDEVWNLAHPWYGWCPLFYGHGLKANRLVSYAASFGNYESSSGLDPHWAEKLRRFERISVRDHNSQTIIKNALEKDVEIVLDPCLQFLPEPEGEIPKSLYEPYLAVYGHNFTPFFIANIKKWAGHEKLRLISIGYRNDWADEQWITAGPHEFVHLMANSRAVATNFFHGCIFSFRFVRAFICESSPYRSTKLQDLMRLMGSETRMVNELSTYKTFDFLLSTPIESEVLRRIEKLRQTSGVYLDRAIEVKEMEIV